MGDSSALPKADSDIFLVGIMHCLIFFCDEELSNAESFPIQLKLGVLCLRRFSIWTTPTMHDFNATSDQRLSVAR
ncbi:hypothetical protein SAMN05444167_1018 [Terriglobus roseus]|uniref:Uncharacterized protein n=1 Tax=Terriglobus roseus TaxID=392734 RepID=A0A1G7HCP8_9BACT|nr:hypothetical protein SAMN05444167_1018 [Terriglobus roseus]